MPPPVFALILAGLALAYATFWLGAFDPYRFAVTAAGIAAAAALVHFTSKPQDRARKIPLWAILPLFLIPVYLALQILPLPIGILSQVSPRSAEVAGWLGLSSAPISIASNASIAFTFRILTAIILFFLIREIAWQHRWITLLPLVAIASLEAVLGLLQAASSTLVVGTYVNRNHYAFLLEMMIPFAIMGGVALLRNSTARRSSGASALFVAAALLLLATIFSLSRGGFLSTLIALFVLAVLNLQKRLRLLGTGVLVVGFVALFFLLPITDLVLRFAESSELNSDVSSGARHLVWKDSFPVIRDFPVFGTGLGGYETAVRRHQETALMHNIAYAHNEYIQFLAELGVVGFVLFLIPIGWILQILIRNLEDPIAKAGIASVTGILLHCIVDFNLQVPANLLAVAWTAGFCASLLPSHRPAVE